MKIRKHKNGQAMVETALVLPLILLLLFGIIEFGRILNTYIMLTNASREGARYSIVRSADDIDAVRTAVTHRIPTIPIDPVRDIQIGYEKDPDTNETDVKVTVKYDLPLIIPVVKSLVSSSGTFHIESSTIMRSESK